MEPRQRTHLVNELMEEARRMMSVLTKAMEGKEEAAHRNQGRLHMPDHAPYPPPTYTLEQEQAAWEQVCGALHAMQAQLDLIELAERERIARLTPSA